MEIRISVRNLVEFLLRGGDIDNRHVAASDKAMQEGTRIHKMIQNGKGPGYDAEVPLSHTLVVPSDRILDEELILQIEGRADGIFKEDGCVFIDEIKSVYRDVDRMKAPDAVHLAQAKCYAYIYSVQMELEEIGVRMTYVSTENDNIRYFDEKYSYEEIVMWFDELVGQYRKWMELEAEHKRQRNASIHGLAFPYPYRSGQKELVENVYKTIYHERKLFLEAPTGVGKTLATVYPSVMAIGNGMGDRIFYLTAKTITRTVAMEAFQILKEGGLVFKTVILTGKEKVCLCEREEGAGLPCNPEACPYAKGHYDRINEALFDCLSHEESITREVVISYAQKHSVCPFELSLDISLFCDGVVCDYNYVFDPHVYLKRFFADGTGSDSIFLVDEAHNLVDRGREMYSAELIKEDFLELKRSIKDELPYIAKLLDACNKEFLALKRAYPGTSTHVPIGSLQLAIQSLSLVIGKFLEDRRAAEKHKAVREPVLNFYFEISHFLLICDLLDEHYVVYTKHEEDGRFRVKLMNVDPSANLQECMARGRSSILFSATFLPIQYYKKLLGGGKKDYEIYADSTFDPRRRGLFIATDVTSKYTSRNEAEYQKIANYIRIITEEKRGNYMVFFPSHAFLRSVYEQFMEHEYDENHMECILQESSMKEEEREAFLALFGKEAEKEAEKETEKETEKEAEKEALYDDMRDQKAETCKSLIGFCVLGGLFSEGIDLKKDALIGAIIVGTGLPQVGEERTILRDYFEEREGNGFDYAYRFPGMNKVLQAAGRVIRTAEDVGIVALLDYRFTGNEYRKLFPREWMNYEEVTRRSIANGLSDFWSEF